jgi:hypothetical protein
MLRAIGAIAAGFIVWTVLFLGSNALLTLITPDSFNPDGSTDSAALLALVLVLSIVSSIVSGWVTARIARVHAFGSSVALGVLLLVVGIGVQLQSWEAMPLWYHLLFLGALLPAVLVGYRWAVNRRQRTVFSH